MSNFVSFSKDVSFFEKYLTISFLLHSCNTPHTTFIAIIALMPMSYINVNKQIIIIF